MNLISMRLRDHHKDEALFSELVSSLTKNKGSCDDVWFCSEYGFPKMETHKKSAQKMAKAAETIRKNGIGASLQLINTLGHGDLMKAMDFSGVTWQTMVGFDGTITKYSNCPRNPDFLEHLYEYTKLYASWRPDYVWVDDDLRMSNHSEIFWGCFCNRCINDFSSSCGFEWSREELVRALHLEKDGTWREKWTRFNAESKAIVMEKICKAVSEVSPETVMAYQHGGSDWSIYDSADHVPIFDVMKKVTGKDPASRPGGGFYTDHAPRELLNKALSINLQNARLPEYVTVIKPEIENFTHTSMGKSPHGTVVEASLHLAYGCSGLSFATFMVNHESIKWHERTLERIALWRPYWERYLKHNRASMPEGLKIAYSKRHMKRLVKPVEGMFEWAEPQFQGVSQMSTMGLPLCYNETSNNAVILHPFASKGMSEEELKSIFSGGVITDGETIFRLQERGLSYLTGIDAEPVIQNSAYERMTKHAFNRDFADDVWYQCIVSDEQKMYAFTTELESKQVLGEYFNYNNDAIENATIAVETPLGGRLVTFGYNFWEPVVSSARRNQILSAADWVSNGNLSVVVDTAAQLVVVPRVDSIGCLISVTVLNVSIDYGPDISMLLRNPQSKNAKWVTPISKNINIEMKETSNGYKIVIPPIAPWSIGYVELV